MRSLTLLLVVLFSLPVLAQRRHRPKPVEAPAPVEAVQLRYPKLIEIDPQQVTGQRNGAGGVYLYDRKQLKEKSMVHERESFRAELYDTL